MTASQSTTPRFHNTLFRAELGRTPAGSPVIRVRATNANGRFGNARQLAACIYELAAEFERRGDDLRARWVVSPETSSARIVLELCDGDDVEAVEWIVVHTLAELGFGPVEKNT